MKSVEAMLVNTIDSARLFQIELINDLKSLNNNIDSLTQSSQKFIETQLSQIKLGTPPSIKRIGNNSDND